MLQVRIDILNQRLWNSDKMNEPVYFFKRFLDRFIIYLCQPIQYHLGRNYNTDDQRLYKKNILYNRVHRICSLMHINGRL